MTMGTMANMSDPNLGRGRVKARVTWLGRDGEQAWPVAAKPDKFIEINWSVFYRRLTLLGIGICIFICGFAFGALSVLGGS